MEKYMFKVTGEYNDWVEVKKGNVVLHNGSVFGLVTYINDRVVSNLNYGKDKYNLSEIKKVGNVIITVPMEKDSNDEYLYIPLVLNGEEFEKFVEISYIDRGLLQNIREATINDVKNILLCNFKNRFKVDMNVMNFDELLDNVIAFSEYDEEMRGTLEKIDEHEIVISRLQEDALTNITMYIDIENNVYEWDEILYDGNEFYIRVTDDYVVQI